MLSDSEPQASLEVVQTLEHAADVGVALGVIVARDTGEFDLWRCSQKFLKLRNRAQLCLVHVDHHPWMIKPIAVGPEI